MRYLGALVLVLVALTALSWAQDTGTPPPPKAFVQVKGGEIYFEECGTGPEAVILIHDGVADSAVWDDVWPLFCNRFHTIRYDRRGYGRSPETSLHTTKPTMLPR